MQHNAFARISTVKSALINVFTINKDQMTALSNVKFNVFLKIGAFP